MQAHPSVWIYIPLIALIAWRFYRRFRRSVGRQHLSKVRPWITVVVFPLLIALFAVTAARAPRSDPLALYALLCGLAVGIILGIYGNRLTRFEATPEGFYYTPSAHLGIALSAVLLIRIGYRFLQGGLVTAHGPPPPPSPMTLLIFGALAGYYTTYAIGLLLWRRSVTAVAVTPSQPQS
ncbi:MAG TPA: hypothetical protein VHB68_13180 [Steroidobacteraceae bacterium]|nr:hypothetical protein [Steroidobacteraceae bacterium]